MGPGRNCRNDRPRTRRAEEIASRRELSVLSLVTHDLTDRHAREWLNQLCREAAASARLILQNKCSDALVSIGSSLFQVVASPATSGLVNE